MKHLLKAMAIAVGAIVGLSACGAGPSSVGGDRLPVQVAGEDYGHSPVSLTGVVVLEGNGCWTIDLGDGPRLVAFPPGYTKPQDDGTVMRGPDGTTVESGTAIDAVGGVVPAAGFPGVPDGYWGNYLAFCEPRVQEFAVLDTLQPAFDPHSLSDDELVALVREANLSEAWGCGIGFAASSEDQRVALILHLRDASDAVEVPVTFPDGGWTAEIVIGKLLMTNWCNDVVESWAPQSSVAARWPLSGGELAFAHPATMDCEPGLPVTATLRNPRVQTPHEEVRLGDLSLINDAYGCFAG